MKKTNLRKAVEQDAVLREAYYAAFQLGGEIPTGKLHGRPLFSFIIEIF